MLAPAQDDGQIIERIAALDIGKAEVVCCVRVPDPKTPGKRLQEVSTHTTMTRSWTQPCRSCREIEATSGGLAAPTTTWSRGGSIRDAVHRRAADRWEAPPRPAAHCLDLS